MKTPEVSPWSHEMPSNPFQTFLRSPGSPSEALGNALIYLLSLGAMPPLHPALPAGISKKTIPGEIQAGVLWVIPLGIQGVIIEKISADISGGISVRISETIPEPVRISGEVLEGIPWEFDAKSLKKSRDIFQKEFLHNIMKKPRKTIAGINLKIPGEICGEKP